MTGKPAGPLDGVTVLDLCSYLAGPYGCTLLADFGANVIKIESPQGDMLRQFPSSLPGESRFFLGTNRGKRAHTRSDAARGLGGVASAGRHRRCSGREFPSFGAGPARDRLPAVSPDNPRLVYAGVAGYGDGEPLSDKGGFDQVLQHFSGMAVFQGGGADRLQVMLGSVLDSFTTALLTYGVAAALFHIVRLQLGRCQCSVSTVPVRGTFGDGQAKQAGFDQTADIAQRTAPTRATAGGAASDIATRPVAVGHVSVRQPCCQSGNRRLGPRLRHDLDGGPRQDN